MSDAWWHHPCVCVSVIEIKENKNENRVELRVRMKVSNSTYVPDWTLKWTFNPSPWFKSTYAMNGETWASSSTRRVWWMVRLRCRVQIDFRMNGWDEMSIQWKVRMKCWVQLPILTTHWTRHFDKVKWMVGWGRRVQLDMLFISLFYIFIILFLTALLLDLFLLNPNLSQAGEINQHSTV